LRRSAPRLGRGQLPELLLSNDGDPVSQRRQAPDLIEVFASCRVMTVTVRYSLVEPAGL